MSDVTGNLDYGNDNSNQNCLRRLKKTSVRILLTFSIYVVKGLTRADSCHSQSNSSKAMCVYIYQEASESLEREGYAGSPDRNFKDEMKLSDWCNRF